MLRTSVLSADIGIHDQSEVETLIDQLRNMGYSPIIRNMMHSCFISAQLPTPDKSTTIKMLEATSRDPFFGGGGDRKLHGEIFFKNGVLIGLYPSYEITYSSIAGFAEETNLLHQFCDDLEQSIKDRFDGRRVRGMQFNWSPKYELPSHRPRLSYTERTDDDEMNFTVPDYSIEDIKASSFLSNERNREFLFKLARYGKMAERDVEKETFSKECLNELMQLGLISKEYLLTCKQDQHTICIMPTKEQDTTQSSPRCSTCGRPFAEENTTEVLTITERGRCLTNNSTWMSIWITELLIKNGIKKEAIRWRLEGNGDELDVLLQDYSSRIFLELKDRDFGLGDAYPFVYRVDRYGGVMGVIITTKKINQDAKKFFQEKRTQRTRIMQLEGNNIQDGISRLIRELSITEIRRMINSITSPLNIDLSSLINLWAYRKLNKLTSSILLPKSTP